MEEKTSTPKQRIIVSRFIQKSMRYMSTVVSLTVVFFSMCEYAIIKEAHQSLNPCKQIIYAIRFLDSLMTAKLYPSFIKPLHDILFDVLL